MAKDDVPEQPRTVAFSINGPALLYVPTTEVQDSRAPVVYRVDNMRSINEGGPVSPEAARRERSVLRALLRHALALLGDDE